jgi:hypothetical protein
MHFWNRLFSALLFGAPFAVLIAQRSTWTPA